MDWFLYDIGLRHERVNESRFKQCGVTPHFPTRTKYIGKNIEKRSILTQSTENSFFHLANSIENIYLYIYIEKR